MSSSASCCCSLHCEEKSLVFCTCALVCCICLKERLVVFVLRSNRGSSIFVFVWCIKDREARSEDLVSVPMYR